MAVIVIWSLDIPVTKRVMAARKICGKYCNINISDKEILSMAKEKRRWTFGGFFGVDAAEILELSIEYGLNIEMADIDSGKKLLFWLCVRAWPEYPKKEFHS